MNILMLTNTYAPHVGGVAHSVQAFEEAYRARGHRVMVVAPSFEGAAEREGVVRVPSLQHFNGSDWSVPVPIPGYLTSRLAAFRPEVVHSHHPFLLGATALRIAAAWDAPCVFTHHTQYERYTHYMPGDSPVLKRFISDLVTGYCNLCAAVVAPSAAIADRLRADGVTVPVEVVPTGIVPERFRRGDPAAFRARWGLPPDAFVVGHVGRLAPEKNLDFLVEAVGRFLTRMPQARALLVGSGPSENAVQEGFAARGLADRLVRTSTLVGDELVEAYRAMDAFAFASTSETQGLVLAEAAAAGVPLVALSGPGVDDVVRDRWNGRLLPSDAPDPDAFADALAWVAARPPALKRSLGDALRSTARELSMERSADRMLALYERLRAGVRSANTAYSLSALLRRASEDVKIFANFLDALLAATLPGEEA